MTIKSIAVRVKNLSKEGAEKAHEAEDGIHRDVLKFIAKYSNDLYCRKLAKAALKSSDLTFPRWYA